MAHEIKVPSPGESVTEAELASWFVEDGDPVSKNQEIGELESEKATLPIVAEQDGTIHIKVQEGETVNVGDVIATITEQDEPGKPDKPDKPDKSKVESQKSDKSKVESQKSKESEESDKSKVESRKSDKPDKSKVESRKSKESEESEKSEKSEESEESKVESPKSKEGEEVKAQKKKDAEPVRRSSSSPLSVKPGKQYNAVKTTPVAREMMEKEGLSVDDIMQGLRKISASDVKQVMKQEGDAEETDSGKARHQSVEQPGSAEATREEDRRKISQLRKKISQRLVAVKNETAMLTTFNEVDMSTVITLRKKYQRQFEEKHGIKLGFMSFFTKAVTESLTSFPAVNSYLDGEEIVTPRYCDLGIAVQSEKGLMVPVIRNAEALGLADIERQIADLAGRARKGRLSIEEMSGGTFTISNGGIYGSMLSTPILNPPQSGILGMHNIIERPVAIEGKVEIRPMMYIALSYDHRVIDGKDSVSFLKSVKTYIEDPSAMLFGSRSAEELLLDI